MPTVEERLAALEARVDTRADVRNLITELRADMNARFTDMDARFTSIDSRFTSIDSRFTNIDSRFASINARFTDLTGLISSLDSKFDRHFVWLMGMMVTGFISVIGALVGVVYR